MNSHRHLSPHKRSRIGCLPRWQRYASHIVFSVCALSGIGFLLAHELHWAPLAPSAHSLLVAHGVSAYLSMLLFGATLPVHIRSAWNVQRNRGSGSAMVLVMGLLAISGLLLYYGSEEIHDRVLWAHWIVGGLSCLALPLHLVLGRRANRIAALAHQKRQGEAKQMQAPIPGSSALVAH